MFKEFYFCTRLDLSSSGSLFSFLNFHYILVKIYGNVLFPKLYYDDVTQKRAPDDVIMMLLGNKNDAVKREVQIQEGADLARVRVHCDPKVLTVLLKIISTKSSVVFSLL